MQIKLTKIYYIRTLLLFIQSSVICRVRFTHVWLNHVNGVIVSVLALSVM